MKLVRQDQHSSSISSSWEPCSASFQPFLFHPRFPLRTIVVFSYLSSIKTSSDCLSHMRPANGGPYIYRSRGTTGSSMFDQDFGHLRLGRRIHESGHADFRILINLGASSISTWVYADAASAGCPSQSGTLAITSITFAAVIWDADEPCSVKTAKAPESSFTMSPRRTTLPLYFWNFSSNCAFLRWQMSINVAKWTFCWSCLCLPDMNLLFCSLLLSNCQAGIVSSFFHFIVHCCFRIMEFSSHWGIGVNLCTKLQWLIELYPLPTRCDLQDFSVEMIPNACLLIRELPHCTHALFLESCWILHSSLQFPEARSASLLLFCKASPPP